MKLATTPEWITTLVDLPAAHVTTAKDVLAPTLAVLWTTTRLSQGGQAAAMKTLIAQLMDVWVKIWS